MRRSVAIVTALVGCGGSSATPDAMIDARVVDPNLLSSTDLYADFAARTLAPDVHPFTPTYALWSDGAVKDRWLWLPPGTQIDSRDAAHWQLPVGAKLWKQFAAPDGKLLETRLIERIAATGDDDVDYRAGSFAWRDDESDADLVPLGRDNVRGTDHDIPKATACRTCHTGEPGFALGLSALQLSEPGPGLRLADAAGLLSTAVAAYSVPGDVTTRTALGYLHANCGHCHNPNGAAWPDVNLHLQLDLTAATPDQTTTYVTTMGIMLTRFQHPGITERVAPGNADGSGLLYRMTVRDPGVPLSEQMPPIATERTDATGIAAVRAWIEAL